MRISTDTFSKPGTDHQICEDHADRSVQIEDVVVVSDGCGSGIKTDIGSRLLTQIAIRVFNEEYCYEDEKIDPKTFITKVLEELEKARVILGIYTESLLATLIIAYRHKRHVHVIAYGDGVIVGRFRGTKEVEVYNIDYLGNAPYYPAYDSDFALKCGYVAMFTEFTENTKRITIFNGERTERMERYDRPVELIFDLEEFDCVLIGTDGMCSFEGIRGSLEVFPPTVEEIAKKFVDFKGTVGKFLQRRVGKEIKCLEKRGIFHYDDLTVAAILAEPEEGGHLGCLDF